MKKLINFFIFLIIPLLVQAQEHELKPIFKGLFGDAYHFVLFVPDSAYVTIGGENDGLTEEHCYLAVFEEEKWKIQEEVDKIIVDYVDNYFYFYDYDRKSYLNSQGEKVDISTYNFGKNIRDFSQYDNIIYFSQYNNDDNCYYIYRYDISTDTREKMPYPINQDGKSSFDYRIWGDTLITLTSNQNGRYRPYSLGYAEDIDFIVLCDGDILKSNMKLAEIRRIYSDSVDEGYAFYNNIIEVNDSIRVVNDNDMTYINFSKGDFITYVIKDTVGNTIIYVPVGQDYGMVIRKDGYMFQSEDFDLIPVTKDTVIRNSTYTTVSTTVVAKNDTIYRIHFLTKKVSRSDEWVRRNFLHSGKYFSQEFMTESHDEGTRYYLASYYNNFDQAKTACEKLFNTYDLTHLVIAPFVGGKRQANEFVIYSDGSVKPQKNPNP